MIPTPSQSAIIESNNSNIVVVAGPGAGKTATLIQRLIRLIRSGVDPLEITVITFTNNAADEITARLRASKVPCCKRDYNGDGDCDHHPNGVKLGYCGTLHGWVMKLLRHNGHLIGLAERLAVIDEESAKDILKETIEEMAYKGSKKALDAELISVQALLSPDRDSAGARLVAASYHMKLLSNGLLDFNSMLAYGLHLLDKHGHKTRLVTQFGFVDEYQDTSILHGKIYQTANFPRFCAIGDTDQSIYGFLKADPTGFEKLARQEAATLFKLEVNYRSDVAIADAANRLITHNLTRIDKSILPVSTEPGKIFWSSFENESCQKDRLIKLVNEVLAPKENCTLQTCAILCKTNWQVKDISSYLKANGVAVKARWQNEEPDDYKLAKKVVAFLCNPNNDIIAYQLIKATHGPAEALRIRSEAKLAMRSINSFQLHVPTNSAFETVPETLARNSVSIESIERVKSTMELIKDKTLLNLSLAMSEYAEPPEVDESGPNSVVISTIHAAKGKEYDSVFLPSWCQELFPAKAKDEKLEECRRLAFVAVTRARHCVWIGSPKKHRKHEKAGMPEDTTPSQFINELGL